MGTKKLPDKKSELIRLAIKDLELCEKDKNYKVDMGVWHTPFNKDGVKSACRVCLAGAVMAKTQGADREVFLLPSNFADPGEIWKYDFLDEVRVYNLDDSGLEPGLLVLDEHKETYKSDPEIFKKNMLQIADWFEEAGL